jgi:enoyl-CoA hydratase/carnithine racemase
MTFANLDLSLLSTVALVRMAKPSDAANSLGMSLVRELQDAVAQAARDPAVGLLVLTGSGRSFSVGADLAEMDGANPGGITPLLRAGQALVRQIMNLDVITVAAVNGLALGGGLELAMACDIRWAHPTAVFGLPEARLGLVPGWGGMTLLWRTVPESLCIEMIAGGERIGARRAYEAGLVSRLFEGRDFEAAVLAAAKEMADKSDGVLKGVKAWLKGQRTAVDLTSGDGCFLSLWNSRAEKASPPAICRADTSVCP